MKNKNILLLGCSGLISSVLLDKLLNLGFNIDVAGQRISENSSVNFIKWDIFGENFSFFDKIKSEYLAIVVTAWSGNRCDERDDIDINMSCAVKLEKTILEILDITDVQQIILTGSQAEYGVVSGYLDEKSEIDIESLSAYGKAKLYLYESLKKSVRHTIVTELRFHSVYGFCCPKKQMLEDVMINMFKDNDVTFYSDGSHHYDFLYVDDAADSIISSLGLKNHDYFNVSSNSENKFCDYIQILKKITKSKSKIVYGNNKSPDFLFRCYKFMEMTNWRRNYSFEEGTLKMFSLVVENMLRSNNVIIYGAGYCGLIFSEMLLENNILPKVFFDSNPEKQGKSFNGISIKAAYECEDIDDIVIVSMLSYTYFSEIKDMLSAMGYKNIKHIYDLCYMENIFKNQPLIFHMPCDWKEINCKKIKIVNELLEDNLSKEVYSSVIEFANGKHDIIIKSFPIEKQYLAYDIYNHNDNEVFIDCGAFKGDVLRFFCEYNCNRFEKYYAIEPDPANFCRIKELSLAKDDRIQVVEYALSDKPGRLKMKNYLNENSVISNVGFDINVDTLDNICDKFGISPTLIKIDVEGFENNLINGAVRTIEKNKPLIAIAIYHKCNDLFEIPIKIHKLLPYHKLFIRSYMNINETILYAVPQERVIDEIY